MSLVRREPTRWGQLVDWMEEELLPMPFLRSFGTRHVIRLEDYIDDKDYVVRAELPGIDPDRDLDITVGDGTLTLNVERREERRDTHRSEFRYGRFHRSVSLPPGADEDDVRATYHNGILEVRVGLKEPEKGEVKHIPIAKG